MFPLADFLAHFPKLFDIQSNGIEPVVACLSGTEPLTEETPLPLEKEVKNNLKRIYEVAGQLFPSYQVFSYIYL